MPRPNVLLIMSDQMKATASHLYGNPFCETPSLERLATEGVLFQNAFTPHPLCVPARCALWTGQWPHANGCRRNETFMPPDAVHCFRLWRAEGFRCGLIGKNHCFQSAEDLALFDVWCEITHGGFPRDGGLTGDGSCKGMEWFRPRKAITEAHSTRRNMPRISPRFSYAVSDYPLEDYSTGLVAGQAARFLEDHAAQHAEQPFALWVSIPDPHTPYEAPRQYAEMFPPERVELPPTREDEFDETAPERNRVLYQMLGLEDEPEQEIRRVVGVYHAMVRFIDDGVGQILDALERTGLRDNTIVVFAADHGDLSGEHNMISKGGAFYDALTHIPMIVSWRGQVTAGAVDDSMVNLVDVAPTLLQLQGLPIPRSMQGTALPTVTDAAGRDATISEYGAGGPAFTLDDLRTLPEPTGRAAIGRSLQWREAEGRRKMVRTRTWKYVHDPMGDRDELYDLLHDPHELHNVIDDPTNAGVVAEMSARLMDWSIMTEDSPPVPLPGPDKYQIGR